MTKLVPLIGLAIGLGALAWYDQSGQGQQEPPASAQSGPVGLSRSALGPDEAAVDSRQGPAEAAPEFEGWSVNDDPATDDSESELPKIANPLATLEKEQLSESVQRPLFAPSRRRPPPAEEKATAAKVAPDEYELLGIAKTNNQAIVLVRRLADGLNFRVQTGDMVGRSQLAKIDGNAIVLTRADGTSHTIRLGARPSSCLPGGAGATCRKGQPKPSPSMYIP